jgi:uncharacterized protein
MSLTRRSFLLAAAAAAESTLLGGWWDRAGALVARSRPAAPRLRLRQFPPHLVRLGPGPVLDAFDVNRRHLTALDPERLLHMFRVTAGRLSSAVPLGGWEAPDNELRGHFLGHYLSACAFAAAAAGDRTLQERTAYVVRELARCQAAHGNGYLSAFPEELFDRLRAGKPAWAPWYTLHKIMAGLLDVHTLTGNGEALAVLRGMAGWTAGWVGPLGDAAMARVLEREYGGMNAFLYDLSEVTGEARWRALAHRFDHERIFEPLASGRDELKGLHANTTVPKIIGAARRYELTGERRYHDAARTFWHSVVEHRCFATGGTGSEENWNTEPGRLLAELGPYSQECCVTYNMRKLTRHLFAWTGDPTYAEYEERTLFNSILGTQHPRDGQKLYYVPMASGWWKLFGTPLHDFWCCSGTGAESFAMLSQGIWWEGDDALYVNQYVPSTLDWQARGVTVAQATRFPEEGKTTLTVSTVRPQRFTLRVRIPAWTGPGAGARLNGRPLDAFAAPGGYLQLERTWRDGDRVELTLPLTLRVEALPDAPNRQAVLYGPLVLAGRLGTEGISPETLRAEPTKPRTVPEFRGRAVEAPRVGSRGEAATEWVEPTGRPLEFRTRNQGQATILVPFAQVIDERYLIYWEVEPRDGLR